MVTPYSQKEYYHARTSFCSPEEICPSIYPAWTLGGDGQKEWSGTVWLHFLRQIFHIFFNEKEFGNYWKNMIYHWQINLGVIDENPSTTNGAIGICDRLSEVVPQYPDGKPFAVVTHCDGMELCIDLLNQLLILTAKRSKVAQWWSLLSAGGAFERMVSAKRVRASAREPMDRLLGLEPSAQEFHKRGIILQVPCNGWTFSKQNCISVTISRVHNNFMNS